MANFTVGLDLGQSRDPSVLAVVERIETVAARDVVVDHHFVRHIQRWEIGTSYTAIVEDVVGIMAVPDLRDCARLRFDATGVGRGIADMFRDARREGRLDLWPEAVTLTAGRSSSGANVAKVDLVGALQRVLQEHRLHVPEDLPGAAKLRQELTDFTAKISAAGRDSYEAATESAHDDHVIAVGLAIVRPHSIGEPRVMGADGAVTSWYPGWWQ